MELIERHYPQRPTVVEINLKALRDNYEIIRRAAGECTRFLAVVKANAYGHGAVEISRELERLGVDFLGVAILEEAIQLRKEGIKARILVLGGLFDGQEGAIFDYDLTPVIFSLSTARRIGKEARSRGTKGKVHVKIDTGMGRIGIRPAEAGNFFASLKEIDAIEVEGAVTHFSSADSPSCSSGKEYTDLQIERFTNTIKEAKSMGFDIPLRHAANSAAIFNFPEGLFNMVRPGIMLYGAYPSPSFKKIEGLRGVMTLKTKIVEAKDVEKGFRVSYGGTYVAPGKRRIAVIPIGYADGYIRALSNRVAVTVKGQRSPVVGRVCMDMTMIDVTGIDGAEKGEDVYLFGGCGENLITVDEVADKAGTISYEILCGISQRVPRVYAGGEE